MRVGGYVWERGRIGVVAELESYFIRERSDGGQVVVR